jgi:hydrogenase maturation protease
MSGRILVAGVGNIFQGDDGFGSEVARRLAGRALPEGVRVADFGIRGFDLAYAMMEPWELVILVDTVARGGAPGTLYVIEPDKAAIGDDTRNIETHGMTPLRAIELVKELGGSPPPMLVVGCEPGELGGEDGHMGLSPAVEEAVEAAIAIIENKLAELRGTAVLASYGKDGSTT